MGAKKISEVAIAALVSTALEKTFDAAFTRTEAMLKEVFQKTMGIYENLQKYMGVEFDEKHYSYPKSVMQKFAEYVVEDYKEEGIFRGLPKGIKEGLQYYYEIESKIGDKDIEEILQSIPEDYFKNKSERYIENFKIGVKYGYVTEIRKEENEDRKQKEKDHLARERDIELLERLFSGEPDYDKFFISPDDMKLEMFSRDKEFSRGYLEGLKFIQENEEYYYKTGIETLVDEAKKRTESETDSFKEGYLNAIEYFKKEEYTKKDKVGLTDTNKEAVQSLLEFQEKLAQDDFVNASASLATFTENIKGLADGLTGENAEEIKTAVNQFGEFSEKAMGFLAAVNQAGSPMSTPAIEGEVVPASFTFTEDQAKLIAQQIVAQMQGDMGAEGDAKKAIQAVTNEDLGIEIRDSKRSILGEIDSLKSSLEELVKEIEKKAMTFDQIYKKLCVTIVREHRNATGRTLR